MKNAMKKLLSLALVAMLLVSVVPMGAMAATFQNNYLTFVYKTADGAEVTRYRGDQPLVGEYDDNAINNGANTFCPNGYDIVGIDLTNPAVSGQDVIYTVTVQQKLEKSVAVVIRLNVKDSGTYDFNVGSVKKDSAPTTMSKQDALIWLKGDASEYNITSSEATADVSDSEYVFPFAAEKKSVYKYTVYVYDWNGNLIKDGATYNATPYQNVTVQADNFYSMKVNGVQLGQGVNYFTLNQNETRVDVTTTTNSGNNPGNNPGIPGQNTFNVYFKGADKTSTVYTYTVTKGNSIGYTAVQTARNAVGDKSGYDFAGWQLDGAGSTLSTETVAATCPTRDVTYYPVFTPKSSKFVNDIYLNIFVNGKADVPAKSIKLNDYTIISDDVINLDEVLTVVDDYYKASNTNKGLQLDGLYVAKGNFVSNWATDSGKSSSISGLKSMRYDSVVGINVMVTNAVVKSSSNADTSNPKTGDDIYMTVTVMGLSAAALCAVYYISKKRAVR